MDLTLIRLIADVLITNKPKALKLRNAKYALSCNKNDPEYNLAKQLIHFHEIGSDKR